MRNLKTFETEKLQTIVASPEVSGVLRDMCFAELQTRFREKHQLHVAPTSTPAVRVSPMIGVPRYG